MISRVGLPQTIFSAKGFLDLLAIGPGSLDGALDLAFALAGLFRFVSDLIILARSHSFPMPALSFVDILAEISAFASRSSF